MTRREFIEELSAEDRLKIKKLIHHTLENLEEKYMWDVIFEYRETFDGLFEPRSYYRRDYIPLDVWESWDVHLQHLFLMSDYSLLLVKYIEKDFDVLQGLAYFNDYYAAYWWEISDESANPFKDLQTLTSQEVINDLLRKLDLDWTEHFRISQEGDDGLDEEVPYRENVYNLPWFCTRPYVD